MSLRVPVVTVHPCDIERGRSVAREMGYSAILVRTQEDWNASTIGVHLPWDWPVGIVENHVRRAAPGWTPVVTIEPMPNFLPFWRLGDLSR